MFIELFCMDPNDKRPEQSLRQLVAVDDIGGIKPAEDLSDFCTIYLKSVRCWIPVAQSFASISQALNNADLLITCK